MREAPPSIEIGPRQIAVGLALWAAIFFPAGPASGDNPPPPGPGPAPAAAAGDRLTTRPLPPRWVFEPWVWEDNINTQQATLDLVTGYRDRDIPVGAVIVDSPWETYYNSLDFCVGTGSGMYEDPRGLIDTCQAMGVRVILWLTGMVNKPGTDSDGCNQEPRPNFCDQHTNQYFVDPDCDVLTHWWKNPSGVDGGKFVDFRDAGARSWWIDDYVTPVLQLGVAGFKVDETDSYVDNVIAGNAERREYSNAYYTTLYEAVVAVHGSEAMIAARPFDRSNLGLWGGAHGGISAPIDANPAGWVGDQRKTWGSDGLLEALDNVFTSSELGYVACGSDIGGFLGNGDIPVNLFKRWTEFGALCSIMENGGNGEHRPWMYGEEMLETYRRYAKLHHALVPYLYSRAIEFVDTGTAIMRPLQGWDTGTNATGTKYTYTLGDDLFVAALYEDLDSRTIAFPPGTWIDFFADGQEYTGTHESLSFAKQDYPLYVRSGAFLPLVVDRNDDDPGFELGIGSAQSSGYLTVLYYPAGASADTLHRTPEVSLTFRGEATAESLAVIVGPCSERFIFRIKTDIPAVLLLNRDVLEERETMSAFESADRGWHFDAGRDWLWVKFEADGGESVLEVDETVSAVELVVFQVTTEEGVVRLSWTTGYEEDHLGFHVSRALVGSERFERLTTARISSIGGGLGAGVRRHYEYIDRTVEIGETYVYELEALDWWGHTERYLLPSVTVAGASASPAAPPRLWQSSPNPFNPFTRIGFELPGRGDVTLRIYDVHGRLVRSLVEGELAVGRHTAEWDGRGDDGRRLNAGVYVCRLLAASSSAAIKMVLVR